MVNPSKKVRLDEHCGKTEGNFKSNRAFQNHYRTHDENLFKCEKCPSVWTEGPENQFTNKKDLITLNYMYHSSEKKCIECQKNFSSKNNLARHIQDFHNNTILACQTCDSVFPNQQNLKRHVQD